MCNLCEKSAKDLVFVMQEYPDKKGLAGENGQWFFDSFEKFEGCKNGIDICQAWIGATQIEHEHMRDDIANILQAVKLKKGYTKMDVAMLITFGHLIDVNNYYWPHLQAMRNRTGETEQEG